MATKRERNFLEAALEGAEAAVDLATDNEAVKAIPIIGTAFKIARGLDDARSRILAAKLTSFLTEPHMQSESTRTKLRRKLTESAEEVESIGELLFLVIDRLVEVDKPRVLARVYLAYLDSMLTAAEVKRLGRAIDTAFGEDLNAFLAADVAQLHDDTQPWLELLEPSGLTRSSVPRAPPGLARTRRTVTSLGDALRKAWLHVPNEP